jgi:hypothetical protein
MRGSKPCNQYGSIELGRIEINKSLPDVELAIMASDNKTIHFFKASDEESENTEQSKLNEESKISEFFRKFKDKVLP